MTRMWLLAATLGTLVPSPLIASEPVESEDAEGLSLSALYKGDVMANVGGGAKRGARALGNAELVADADLDRIAGWSGARAKLHLLSVHGGTPNALTGSLQGVDNIEVADDRTKLYELWLEQEFASGHASLLAGLTDLNVEFYQNDAAGLLIAPAFGVGSELAATGPNGPSIFPSTALAVRVAITPDDDSYVKLGLFNARAGVPGDKSGVDLSFSRGALAIAEAGLTKGGKLAVGVWRYTQKQDDIHETDGAGNPASRTAQGAYLLGERRIAGSEQGRQVNAFFRAGLSDGDTTPFRGGWQAGLLVAPAISGRPGSAISLGVNQAYVTSKFRRKAAEEGDTLGSSESAVELTYQDKVAPFLTVQPDVQYVINPGANRATRNALLMGLRVIVSVPAE